MPSELPRIQVELCWTDGEDAVVLGLDLPADSSVADALDQARTQLHASRLPERNEGYGIWSVRCDPETRLHSGDRIEIYQPLTADPKSARRSRVEAQRRVQKPGR